MVCFTIKSIFIDARLGFTPDFLDLRFQNIFFILFNTNQLIKKGTFLLDTKVPY